MGDMTKNFSRREFDCRCGCGTNVVTQAHVKVLQQVRDEAELLAGREIMFTVRSGSRCPDHNRLVGGKKTSEHLVGFGTDIVAMDARTKFYILKAALNVGVTRIGIGATFMHLGTHPEYDPEVVWIY